MKRLLLLLVLVPIAHAWTGIAGNCVMGNYNGSLTDVLYQADKEDVVNIVVCGEWVLPWGESIDVKEVHMTGGVIRAERPVYLRIEAEEIEINSTTFENVYLILKGRDVRIRDVNIDVQDYYCVKLVAEAAEINGLHVSRCEQGMVGEVNELFLAGFSVTNVADATDLDVEKIHIFPVKELITVEKVVEINAPCSPPEGEPCDVSPYVKRILELEKENERLSAAIIEAQNTAEEYKHELENIKENMRKEAEPIDVSWLAALFAVGLGIGYLLGRT